MSLLPYLLLGTAFGAVLTESEVISWFRIQEMFRFEAFHMFGIIGAAIVVAGVGLALIRGVGLRASDGSPLALPKKALGRGIRYLAGGSIFGVGWALTGACPGPLVALVAGGVPVMVIGLVGALAGTWAYGFMRERLPH